jgi:hypothetical protein
MSAPSVGAVSVTSTGRGAVHRQCAFAFSDAPDKCTKRVLATGYIFNLLINNNNKTGTLRAELAVQFCIFLSGEFS